MLTIRRDKEIHREEGGWFSARWHFSFAHYRDPDNDAFGAMRVFNDDRLVPGAIWPMHPHQDASVHVASLAPGDRVEHPLGPGRGAYAYLIDGQARFDGEPVATGDAAKVTGQPSLEITAEAPSELILVDVPLAFRPVGIWAGQGG